MSPFHRDQGESAPFIHKLADCQSPHVGERTRIWQFSVVLANAVIGRDCNINCHCFVESDVVLGDRVTVKAGVYLWNGMVIEDDVFIGPNATFTNDRFPRSRAWPAEFPRTTIRRGASIGAAAVILPGLEIGEGAMVGAGAVVTRDVPPHTLVIGSPARVVRSLSPEAMCTGGPSISESGE